MTEAPREFFNQAIEPKACRWNCEYYDGGGLKPNGDPVNERGDCGNFLSPVSATTANATCKHFFPCVARWPEADHS